MDSIWVQMSFLSFLFFPPTDRGGRAGPTDRASSKWELLALAAAGGKKLAGVDTEIAERLDVVNSRRQSHKEKEGKREE